MFRLAVVAVVALLVSESSQKSVRPSEAPDTTNEGLHFLTASDKPVTQKPGWEGLKKLPYDKEPGHLDDFMIPCWTDWFDRDNPGGTGDWETTDSLRKQNPGKICPKPLSIDVQTLSGQSVLDAGENIFKMDVASGFVCRNADQPDYFCEDYKVRFLCFAPYCASSNVCWTKWYDRDNPSGTGDWELLKDLRKENPGEICAKPTDMEVTTTAAPPQPASSTGEVFYQNTPSKGFVCRNKDQKDGYCLDYRVRFRCPC